MSSVIRTHHYYKSEHIMTYDMAGHVARMELWEMFKSKKDMYPWA
jgi:hypothetical protein